MNSPRTAAQRPQSAPTSRKAQEATADTKTSGGAAFYGVRRMDLRPRDGVIFQPHKCHHDATPSPRSSSPRNAVSTQREVSNSLRQTLLNLERKKLYGASTLTRPMFLVSRRVQPPPPLTDSDQPKHIPAPPVATTGAAVSSREQRPEGKSKPSFYLARSRKTIFDIQVEAAKHDSLQHTEPFVAMRPFSRTLRQPEDETREYYTAELEAGYYKRWICNVEGEKPPLPHSIEAFFGEGDQFSAQDEEKSKEWKEKVVAACHKVPAVVHENGEKE